MVRNHSGNSREVLESKDTVGNRWIALHRDHLIKSSVQLRSWDFPGPSRNSPEGLQGECTVHFRFEAKLSEN